MEKNIKKIKCKDQLKKKNLLKNGIYIKILEEFYNYNIIDKFSIQEFKQIIGFMDEKELIKLMNYCDKTNQDYRYCSIQGILNNVK